MTRMMLIGVAGMDWAGFDSQTGKGALPRMSALRARGVAGWLAGAPPGRGPAAWASLASGVEPEHHGVYRGQEEGPAGVRPVGRSSWRRPPVWAPLQAAGFATASIAWPATRPGRDWAGVHIDETFIEATGRTAADWALPLNCTPEWAREPLRHRRVHPLDITASMLRPLVPRLADIDQSRDDGLPLLAVGLAAASTIQSAATWLVRECDARADALFVHHGALGQARTAFAHRKEAWFQDVIPAAWRFLDGLVGHLADLAGPDALVMVVSPGWESSPGVWLAAGPGVRAEAEIEGASLLDIAPTVLGRFGLMEPSMPGRPLIRLVSRTDFARPPAAPPVVEAKADPLLVHSLRRHGYRPPPRPDAAWRADGLAELALLTLERDPLAARRIAETALAENPGNVIALRVKARSHVMLEEPEPLPDIGRQLLQAAPDRGWGPLAQGAYHVLRQEYLQARPWLQRAEADPDPGTLLTVAALWLAAGKRSNAERVFRAVLARDPLNASAEIGMAMAALDRRDFIAAESALLRARRHDPGRPAIYLQLARLYATTARRVEADRCVATAVRLGAPEALARLARGDIPPQAH
jgi:Tfp pilus assembly protein PilF